LWPTAAPGRSRIAMASPAEARMFRNTLLGVLAPPLKNANRPIDDRRPTATATQTDFSQCFKLPYYYEVKCSVTPQ